MKTKNVALGGAAIFALAGLLSFMPTPLFAQSALRNQPQESSPAEKQATRELNEKYINGMPQPAPGMNDAIQAAPEPLPASTAPRL